MYSKQEPRTNREYPEMDLNYENTHSSFAAENPAEGKAFPEKKLGRLPAMGWNSWNAFGTGNTAALTKQMADCFIQLGLDKLGYKYLVLDDGCYGAERVNGRLTNESVKFPQGFKDLANYIHSKGLKFGMYNDIGTNLCAGSAVGTCGFEDLDAQSYADWDIDFLKVDNCYYLWDNATFSNSENAKYSYAPNIKSMKITNAQDSIIAEYNAVEFGKLAGLRAEKNAEYVTKIGTFDGTNTGTTPVGPRYGELIFNITAPESGQYNLFVEYASGKEEGCGQWLQVAVGKGKNENRFFDDLLPETKDNTSFQQSNAIKIHLEKGENILRLMNHRRQENVLTAYGAMFYGLQKAKPNNDIVLSICEWGKTHPQNWGFKVGDSWRILNDITFCVGSDGNPGKGEWGNPGTQSIASQYNKCVIMDEFAGLTRGWNDPDMMVIGMNGITTTMSKTHMSMWCMMNSPLMLGLDLRRIQIGDELYNIIANKELIALNQDALGIQAKRIWTSTGAQMPDKEYITNNNRYDVLAKPLSDGSVALSLFNLSETENTQKLALAVDFIKEKLGEKVPQLFTQAKSYKVKDLWTNAETSLGEEIIFPPIAPCDSIVLKIIPQF
ncbi:MAG: alpha-galactosidase [Treponema sp.]|nr:alpha-galactosidase [Treponema sp.]